MSPGSNFKVLQKNREENCIDEETSLERVWGTLTVFIAIDCFQIETMKGFLYSSNGTAFPYNCKFDLWIGKS